MLDQRRPQTVIPSKYTVLPRTDVHASIKLNLKRMLQPEKVLAIPMESTEREREPERRYAMESTEGSQVRVFLCSVY